MEEYRISEYLGVFEIEVRGFKTTGMWWWKKKVYEWYRPNIWGGVIQNYPVVQPHLESFKTIEDARNCIKVFKKGIIYHSE